MPIISWLILYINLNGKLKKNIKFIRYLGDYLSSITFIMSLKNLY